MNDILKKRVKEDYRKEIEAWLKEPMKIKKSKLNILIDEYTQTTQCLECVCRDFCSTGEIGCRDSMYKWLQEQVI